MSDMNGLTITDVKFSEYKNGALLAFADVTFNEVMTVKGFKIFAKDGRTWCSPPSEKTEDGKYNDRLAWPKEWYGKDQNPLLGAIVDRFAGGKSSSGTSKAPKAKRPAEDERW